MSEDSMLDPLLSRSKVISVYGIKYTKVKRTYKQRYWIKIESYVRKDGVEVKSHKKRVWKKVIRRQIVRKPARFDISGSGNDIYRALGRVLSKREPLVPKERHVEVEAREFLEHPWDYAEVGEWTTIKPSIESL